MFFFPPSGLAPCVQCFCVNILPDCIRGFFVWQVRDRLKTESPNEAQIDEFDPNYNETKYLPECFTDF